MLLYSGLFMMLFYIVKRQALFIVSMFTAKPVLIMSVFTVKPVFVVSVGLRVF